jgi:hypothetical protein
MADEFMDQLKDDSADIFAKIIAGEDLDINLDIEKIDEVFVSVVNLRFYRMGDYKRASMVIYVEDSRFTDEDFDQVFGMYEQVQDETWTLEFVQTFMKKVATTLASLKFDAMTTTFVKCSRKRKCWEFLNCDNVKMKHGSCACHCEENTRRKTWCGHYLCLRCEQQIKFVGKVKPCPICRKTIDEKIEE